MIRIDRGDEPEDLVREREVRLAMAHVARPPSASAEFIGYDCDAVRERLAEKQQYKCAYCEFGVQEKAYPIEHFHPKLQAENPDWGRIHSDEPPDDPTQIAWNADTGGYWWLAWTWENLFYSCPTCNSRTYKGNRFPLQRGASPLLAMTSPLPSQPTLLLDPGSLDPLDHIQFVPDKDLDHWKPVGLTLRGRWTIRIFGFDKRPSLYQQYSLHVKRIRRDSDFIAVNTAIDSVDVDRLLVSWTKICDALLSEEQPFLALTYCFLDQEVRVRARKQLNVELPLPKPGKIANFPQNPLVSARSDLADFDLALQWRIRALGRRASSSEQLRDLIVDIVRARNGCTAVELSNLLARNIDTLRREYLDPLCQLPLNLLNFDSATQRYCPP